jgi:hypothetical protein
MEEQLNNRVRSGMPNTCYLVDVTASLDRSKQHGGSWLHDVAGGVACASRNVRINTTLSAGRPERDVAVQWEL